LKKNGMKVGHEEWSMHVTQHMDNAASTLNIQVSKGEQRQHTSFDLTSVRFGTLTPEQTKKLELRAEDKCYGYVATSADSTKPASEIIIGVTKSHDVIKVRVCLCPLTHRCPKSVILNSWRTCL